MKKAKLKSKNLKDKLELNKMAEDVTKEIVERFVKIFSDKMEEMVREFGEHIDNHMDDLEDMIQEGFDTIHNHLKVIERIEKLEKKMKDVEKPDTNYVS